MLDSILEFYILNENLIIESMAYWMIFIGIITFIKLLNGAAPYGRYSNYVYGFPIPAKFGWFLQEFPSFFISLLATVPHLFVHGLDTRSMLALMFCGHYFHRSLVYPMLMNDKAQPMPVFISFLAFVFCSYNGLLQSLSVFRYRSIHTLEVDLCFLIGFAAFVLGMSLNLAADHQLRQLQRRRLDREYLVPRGGLFELVSCANYSGELLEWIGFALAARNPGSWAFAAFTAANLVPRAISHHRWYQTKFEDYPKSRRAIIPFLL